MANDSFSIMDVMPIGDNKPRRGGIVRPTMLAAATIGVLWPVSLSDFRFTGDSAFGRITAVGRADQVVFAHAAGNYNLRLVGIVVPRDSVNARAATNFVRDLTLNRNARMRLEGRLPTGELLARLFTADSVEGIREVSVEVLRAGLVQRQPNYDLKYGELAAAELEARRARRGIWSSQR